MKNILVSAAILTGACGAQIKNLEQKNPDPTSYKPVEEDAFLRRIEAEALNIQNACADLLLQKDTRFVTYTTPGIIEAERRIETDETFPSDKMSPLDERFPLTESCVYRNATVEGEPLRMSFTSSVTGFQNDEQTYDKSSITIFGGGGIELETRNTGGYGVARMMLTSNVFVSPSADHACQADWTETSGSTDYDTKTVIAKTAHPSITAVCNRTLLNVTNTMEEIAENFCRRLRSSGYTQEQLEGLCKL